MITLYGQFPPTARHVDDPAALRDIPVVRISRHRATPRGWRNAFKRACAALATYYSAYGSMASCHVWAEFDGQRLELHDIESQTW